MSTPFRLLFKGKARYLRNVDAGLLYLIALKQLHYKVSDESLTLDTSHFRPHSPKFHFDWRYWQESEKTLDDINVLRQSGGRPYVLVTGSFIGEGFDFPELDTLIIAMPVSFKGKLIQYAGRLHRTSPGKTDALIYDYLDTSSALTVSMFRKRLAACRKMEYRIDSPAGTRTSRMSQLYDKAYLGLFT